MKLLLICLLLAGCVSAKTNKIYSHSAIEATAETYKELMPGVSNANGFVDYNHCDSLLFTSLANVGGHTANLKAAKKGGQWYRRDSHSCYRDGNSKSTISRDMLTGVALASYSAREPRVFEHLIDYGIANNFVMGQGEKSRTFMTPQLTGLIARAGIASGSTKINPALSKIPYAYSLGKNTGYQAHLEALAILLDGDIAGKLGPLAMHTVKAYYKREPENALFNWLFHKYTDGDFAEVYDILLDRKHWPRYRLPTSGEHCEFWLWQRTANNNDWKPCPAEGHTHSGGDYLFIYSLLKRGGLRER